MFHPSISLAFGYVFAQYNHSKKERKYHEKLKIGQFRLFSLNRRKQACKDLLFVTFMFFMYKNKKFYLKKYKTKYKYVKSDKTN